MAISKVLAFALSFAFLFLMTGGIFSSSLEKVAGNAATLVVIGLTCTGAIFGSILGGVQVIVDAINKKSSN